MNGLPERGASRLIAPSDGEWKGVGSRASPRGPVTRSLCLCLVSHFAFALCYPIPRQAIVLTFRRQTTDSVVSQSFVSCSFVLPARWTVLCLFSTPGHRCTDWPPRCVGEPPASSRLRFSNVPLIHWSALLPRQYPYGWSHHSTSFTDSGCRSLNHVPREKQYPIIS